MSVKLSENAQKFMKSTFDYSDLKLFRDEWFPTNTLNEVAYGLEHACTLEQAEGDYLSGFLLGINHQKRITGSQGGTK